MNTKSLKLLNRALADELSAIHQYLYFHFHCDDQGYEQLATLFKKTAIQEMGHLDTLATRILFLEGDVEMKAAQEIKQLTTIKEMLAEARKMEAQSMQDYNQWANESANNADAVSRQLFENLVKEEEKHYNQFDLEIKRIEQFGVNYLALQSQESNRKSG